MKRLWRVVGALQCCIVATLAAEQAKLAPFALVGSDGRATTSAALVRPGTWILIYVPSECGGCTELLKLVAKDDEPRLPSRIAIIVRGATVDVVRTAAAMFPDLAEAQWYGDPTGASAAPLHAGTAPAVIGMNGDVIEWTIAGALGSSADVKSVMMRWVTR